ncbi:MAG: ABC transporter permease [Bacteroidales bacterium]|nr:ABC transporter permease [Bacteroidales bacterium]
MILFNLIYKEALLLFRDKMGLAFLVVMPIALVLLMTLLQDSTFKALENEKIDVILVNFDQDILGEAMITALDSAEIFNVSVCQTKDSTAVNRAKKLVNEGSFKMGIVIPTGATKQIRKVISGEIKKQTPMAQSNSISKEYKANIQLFFDPIIKASFKQAVSGAIREIMAQIQTQMVFKSYTKALERITGKPNDSDFPLKTLEIHEEVSGSVLQSDLPNSSQHNVPAWTVFAIFFMVIPLTGQIISERNEGTLERLRTFPTPIFIHFSAKILVYTFVAILQVFLLFAMGCWLMPYMDLPKIEMIYFGRILWFTVFVGLAASSYAITVGILSKSAHQAAIFGSISVVILAAIGGIWVPVYIMNDTMQNISLISPLNWALSGYYKVLLHQSPWFDLWPEILLLSLFSGINLVLAVHFFRRQKR